MQCIDYRYLKQGPSIASIGLALQKFRQTSALSPNPLKAAFLSRNSRRGVGRTFVHSVLSPDTQIKTTLSGTLKVQNSSNSKPSATMSPSAKGPHKAGLHNMVPMAIAEAGILRWDTSAAARKQALPSLSFSRPQVREEPLEGADISRKPAFVPRCQEKGGVQVAEIQVPSGTSFYGTGEVPAPLERSGSKVICWNTDAWGYGRSTPSLYQSHPWVLALLPSGEALGVLADTTQRCEVDLKDSSRIKFSAPAPFPVVTVGPFVSPQEVIAALFRVTGCMPMPPRWALGYHQCRFSYVPAHRVIEVARTFRERNIPLDVIWMDIDYMEGFRCFTFDKETFPDPEGLNRELHKLGVKAVWMLDPGIKAEEGFFAYDSGQKADVWVQRNNGKPFVGDVWPGPCVFPDYTTERARTWWAGLVKEFAKTGLDGIWNDMNEPSVFQVMSKTMPTNNVHRGDSEVGGKQPHEVYHNVYGMLMARSTTEGMLAANPERRPFVLTRANFIGGQRYAATWTGDNLADWEHLHFSIPMALNLGLSGQPFSGPDIGGFAGDSSARLYARWMGIGALLPFARGHSETGTRDHEPWSFGKDCEDICRLAIARRYRLLPHLYTLFFLAHKEGSLIASPLFFEDPSDSKLRQEETSFLLGPILVSASTSPTKRTEEEAVLPKGTWRTFDLDDWHPELPTLFLKGGSIVPTGPVVQYSDEGSQDTPLTLIVSLSNEGTAEGVLFEDAGDGWGYQKGEYWLTKYQARTEGNGLVVSVCSTEGKPERPRRKLNVRLLLNKGAFVEGEGWDGEEVRMGFPTAEEQARAEAQAHERRRRAKRSAEEMDSEPELEEDVKGTAVDQTPLELVTPEWRLTLAPWSGGRITSMQHLPTGLELLDSSASSGGYEEYSGSEYRSAGCSEPYHVLERSVEGTDGVESVELEGDIGGGLAMRRRVALSETSASSVDIQSAIVGKNIGAGSGGFSRPVRLRVHPEFRVADSVKAHVSFVSIKGERRELRAQAEEVVLQGDDRPKGEWRLVSEAHGTVLVNRFNVEKVELCLVHWRPNGCNLELWSPEQPVSATAPLSIGHSYYIGRK